MTRKGGLQRRQQRQTLFAEYGQVATNASKGLSESLAAEAKLYHHNYYGFAMDRIRSETS